MARQLHVIGVTQDGSTVTLLREDVVNDFVLTPDFRLADNGFITYKLDGNYKKAQVSQLHFSALIEKVTS